MTKIIYCITKGNWGGAQHYVYDLATTLPKDKYTVSVLLGEDGLLGQKLREAGIQTIILESFSRDVSLWKDLKSLIKLVGIFRHEKPDIIHLNSSKMGLWGALAGRIVRIKKIIFTGHGWAFNEERSILQKKIIYYLHRLTISLAHKVIMVSEETKKQIISKGKENKKIIVIKNAPGEISFLTREEAKEILKEKLGNRPDLDKRPWLGTISELHKNKGLEYLIEAAYQLKISFRSEADLPIFIIIGEGEERVKLQEKIMRYGLENTVFMVGQISEAARYLKALDIFTLTSITEALPYAVLEAGQANLPIIATSVGGIPEIIRDMVDGILIRPREPKEIEKAINFLLNNPEKMTSFGQSICNKISTDFNKETMVKRTFELYNY